LVVTTACARIDGNADHTPAQMTPTDTPPPVPAALVWDLPLRAFHWLLVLTVAGSFATHYAGIEWFDWHRRLGYATCVLVGFRCVWGFVGTRHSRFRSFLRSPVGIVAYLKGRESYPLAGHNPLGGASVAVFLLLLLLQAGTGLFANDEIANAGPFYGWITQDTSNLLTRVHALNANALLAGIGLHLLAVGWYDLVRRRGLTRVFLVGRKPGAEPIPSSRTLRALVIVLLLAGALALAIRAAPEPTFSFF
jgi:cytochrome b